MECKFCGKELKEGQTVCQRCLKLMDEEMELRTDTPETEKEKVPVWKMIVAGVVLLIMLAVLSAAVYYGITGSLPFGIGEEETTAPTTAATDPTEATRTPVSELGMVLPEVVNLESYVYEDATALEKGDEVIATYGEYTLTNKMLQIYYWTAFSNFLTEASQSGYDVATVYKLDYTKPLDTQYVLDYDCTWDQYFVHEALYSWWKDAVINTMADEAGYEMTEEDVKTLESVATALESNLESAGYKDVEELVDDRLGAACDLEDYVVYLKLSARSQMYRAACLASYEPTDEEIEEFFSINEDYYGSMGITKEAGKGVNVRHVLIQPEGATKDENSHIVADDAQWEACRKEAQALLDEWAKGERTEESFGELAKEHSVDGSASTGGLYENVTKGMMVQNFNDWIFDETRKSGDYGLVKTEFGYHLMYFVSATEQDIWYSQAREDAISYGYGFNMTVTETMSGDMLEPDYNAICLSDISQEAVETETTEPTAAPTEGAEAETSAPTEAK